MTGKKTVTIEVDEDDLTRALSTPVEVSPDKEWVRVPRLQYIAIVNQARSRDITGTTCTGCIDGVELIWFICDLMMRIFERFSVPSKDKLVIVAKDAGCTRHELDQAFLIAHEVGERRQRRAHFVDVLMAIVNIGLNKVRLGAENKYLAVEDLKTIRECIVDKEGIIAKRHKAAPTLQVDENTTTHTASQDFSRNDVEPEAQTSPEDEPKMPDSGTLDKYKLN